MSVIFTNAPATTQRQPRHQVTFTGAVSENYCRTSFKLTGIIRHFWKKQYPPVNFLFI